MSKTDQGAGNRARLVSPYMNTTGRCLELYYWIRSADDHVAAGAAARNRTQLSIVAMSEQLDETTVADVGGGSTVDFIRLFAALPHGVHRVVIEGRRDARNVECAVSIDDVAVMDCARFGMCLSLLVAAVPPAKPRIAVVFCRITLAFAGYSLYFTVPSVLCLQCFDTVGWAAGRASGL